MGSKNHQGKSGVFVDQPFLISLSKTVGIVEKGRVKFLKAIQIKKIQKFENEVKKKSLLTIT